MQLGNFESILPEIGECRSDPEFFNRIGLKAVGPLLFSGTAKQIFGSSFFAVAVVILQTSVSNFFANFLAFGKSTLKPELQKTLSAFLRGEPVGLVVCITE